MSDPINDATAFGVRVVAAEVAHGATYWKAVRVHHLTPEENQGRHHIFVDAIDEEGNRLFGVKALISWDGGRETLVIDKPISEPGANLPMWKWQVCAVEMLDMPSERVENLRTDHPDEATGNTMFHHSFEIVFQRVLAAGPTEARAGSLWGRVPNGVGHTIALFLEGEQVSTTVVSEEETYRFEHLLAGEYICRDLDDGREAGPVTVDGKHESMLDFGEPSAPRAITHYVLFASQRALLVSLQVNLLADYLAEKGLTFGFSLTDATHARAVTLVGEQPEATLRELRAAGCQIHTLPTEPSELLAAVAE